MLDKFQDQDLMASIELLEDALKGIHNAEINDTNLPNAIVLIRIAIDKIKKIHPSLFNYPRVARYMEEGEIRGEISRKHIKKLNEEMKKNADT